MPPPAKPPKPARPGTVKDIDWKDFRDHLSTADSEGRRQWLYPRKVQGPFYRGRTWLSWLQLAGMFAVALLIFVTSILVFTAAYGRLWCGWICPQTVLMEMVFRKIEYLIEGDSHQQRALDKAPWTAAKSTRLNSSHLGISY